MATLRCPRRFMPPSHRRAKVCPTLIIERRERDGETLTDVNVAILVQPVDDEGEDEADVAGVVVG